MEALVIGATVASLASGALTAVGAIRQGQAADAAARFEARQLDARAKEAEAAGQQAALERRRQAEVLKSRAIAVAGASGTGVLDPDVINIVSGISAVGEQNFQAELAQARGQAELQRSQAEGRRFEGREARQAGIMRGAATALGTLADTGMFFGQPKTMFGTPGSGTAASDAKGAIE